MLCLTIFAVFCRLRGTLLPPALVTGGMPLQHCMEHLHRPMHNSTFTLQERQPADNCSCKQSKLGHVFTAYYISLCWAHRADSSLALSDTHRTTTYIIHAMTCVLPVPAGGGYSRMKSTPAAVDMKQEQPVSTLHCAIVLLACMICGNPFGCFNVCQVAPALVMIWASRLPSDQTGLFI
jgi:hypothetical protein